MSHNDDARDTTPIGDYNVEREIGQGSFARVYQASETKPPYSVVAVKSVLRSRLTQKLLENLDGEINILKAIRHPHIVTLIGITNTGSHIHLIMEYCPLGDLSFFIKKREKFGLPDSAPILHEIARNFPNVQGAGLNETLVRHFLQQLSSALKFLRSKNLMHRDVKPQNLLLKPPAFPHSESGVGLAHLPMLKLADFGFARYLQEASMAETLCGSPLYMAPEILRSERYDASVDLWSIGTVLYEMLVGKPPFRANNHIELLRKIDKAKDEIKFPMDVVFNRQIQDLIRSLLRLNPKDRISFDQFFSHPLISEPLQVEAPHIDEATALQNSMLRRPSPSHSGTSPIAVPHVSPHHSRQVAPAYVPAFITDFIPSNTPAQPSHLRSNTTMIEEHARADRTAHRPGRDQRDDVGVISPDPRTRSWKTREELLHDSPADSRCTRERSDLRQAHSSDGQSKTSSPRSGSFRELDGARSRESEGEYVVIEKRTVEVNAFADAMAEPSRPVHNLRKYSSGSGRILPSHFGSPPSGANNATVQALATAERRLGSSPASALAKALNIASQRLFGGGSPPSWLWLEQMVNNGNTPSHASLRALGTRNDSIRWSADQELMSAEEEALVRSIEELSAKTIIVYEFGELKLRQLVPSPPNRSLETTESLLTNEAIVSLCEEALALYLKTLQLLQRNIDAVQHWMSQSHGPAPPRLNDIVQWTRGRYNEVLEKAEFLQRRKNISLALVAPDYPFEQVTAEKLLYDRALELGRGAAVYEIVGEDLSQCEGDYETSVLMLEAILANTATGESTGSDEDKIEEDDVRVIERWIGLTRTRLQKLREKIDQMKSMSLLHDRRTSDVKLAPALAQEVGEAVY